MPSKKTLFLILVVSAIILAPFTVSLSFLPLYISLPCFLLLSLLLLFYFSRLFVQMVLFPGSFRLYRRSTESYFCKEMSGQLLQRIQEIRTGIEVLLNIATTEEREDFIPASSESLLHSKKLIHSIIENYKLLQEESSLSEYQESLMSSLTSLKETLINTKLCVADESPVTLWDWFDHANYSWGSLIFEDFPQNIKGGEALATCIRSEELIMKSCAPVSFAKRLKRWLKDTSLGTLVQMRMEFEIRYSVEQIWVVSDDDVSLDCMHINSLDGTSDAPVMLICNSNSTYYELANYSNQWLDLFLQAGLHVFLWNYRGYGRSKGRSTMNRLKRDGEIIYEYIKTAKNCTRIGVYGEGLGGCIAAHIAKVRRVDLLIADRCFSSLEKFVHLKFCREKSDVKTDFIHSECYKILTYDPTDPVINDLDSLKSGISVSLLGESSFLMKEDVNSLLESLKCLMKTVSYQVKSKKQTESYKALPNGQLDEELLTSNLCKIFSTLDSLDAGGKPLSHINNMRSLKNWLVTLDVYGSYLPLLPTDIENSRLKTQSKLKESIEAFESIYRDLDGNSDMNVSYVLLHLKNITRIFNLVLLQYEKTWFEKSGLPSDDSNIDINSAHDPGKIGYLIPYSSSSEQAEKMQMEYHLTQSLFLE